jgi:hypothetical protein
MHIAQFVSNEHKTFLYHSDTQFHIEQYDFEEYYLLGYSAM